MEGEPDCRVLDTWPMLQERADQEKVDAERRLSGDLRVAGDDLKVEGRGPRLCDLVSRRLPVGKEVRDVL
jgi:hypothetical protein